MRTTCGASLVVGASCEVTYSALFLVAGFFDIRVIFYYFDGTANQSGTQTFRVTVTSF